MRESHPPGACRALPSVTPTQRGKPAKSLTIHPVDKTQAVRYIYRMKTNLRPLTTNCPDCRTAPTHRTRQTAFGARPVGPWYGVCDKHLPGNRLHTAAPELRAILERTQAHEVEAL